LSFDSAGECYDWVRKQFEELKVFSVPGSFDVPAQVWPLNNDRHQDFKDAIKALGWPPRDGGEWDREKGMAEVERRGPEYF
jgi:hypothetical protein